MGNSSELEIYRQQRQGQDKYVYFLLAAAGASIAFALNQTKGLALAGSQWSLGVSVACWALSFLTGCSRLLTIDENGQPLSTTIRSFVDDNTMLNEVGRITFRRVDSAEQTLN